MAARLSADPDLLVRGGNGETRDAAQLRGGPQRAAIGPQVTKPPARPHPAEAGIAV
jgi:hypothetical protein